MKDNLELITDILMKDIKSSTVLIEMAKKKKDCEYGELIIKYEMGNISCIKSVKSIK